VLLRHDDALHLDVVRHTFVVDLRVDLVDDLDRLGAAP
jgi:hypothetical protein